MSSIQSRVAGAPISWGVCEAPGWGYQLPSERVLTEMRCLGIVATEFGPEGFLADEPAKRSDQLRTYDLAAVGGFLPVVLHDPHHDPMPQVDRFIDSCLAADATVMVVSATGDARSYDRRPVLDESGWAVLLGNLDRIDERARGRGITASMHPHMGTMVEQHADVDRVLAESHVGLCVDSGHLRLGGTDPVALVSQWAERVTHVHLKDVDETMAARVTAGEVSFTAGVAAGLFRPLGQGGIDIVALVKDLERFGYRGWYVLEQDLMLDGEPTGEGPAANVRQSLEYLLGAVA